MADTNTSIIPWHGSDGILISPTLTKVEEIVPYAYSLQAREKDKVIKAFQSGVFDMGAEYLWKRAMSRLRTTIATMGMKFVGEMIDRNDIDEYSSPENVLTDYETIRLAESLGIVSLTGALRLRQAFELLSHFSNPETTELLSQLEAVNVVRSCIQYVMGDQEIGLALDFTRIRDRLISETLQINDTQVQQLIASPPFFLKTALRVVLASIKTKAGKAGAVLENSLANLNLLLPSFWPKIGEQDRWSVGTTYAEISATGNSVAISGIKQALLKVSGFDYVPENLRSNTYISAAQAVINAHFSFSNYHLELLPVQRLASLGTTIPRAALAECIQALLSVYLGNSYGYSFAAAPTAETELRKLSKDRWQYYIDKILPGDEIILTKLQESNPRSRFISLVQNGFFNNMSFQNINVSKLIEGAIKGNEKIVKQISSTLYRRLH